MYCAGLVRGLITPRLVLILTALPYSGTLSALCSSTRASFNRKVDLFRFDILNLTAHRGCIDIQATQNVCRSGDANRTAVSLKWLSRRLISMPRRRSSCFDVVIKRAAQAQQTRVVCWLQGDFASVYVQTVPLICMSPEAEHSPAYKEIIHATGKRRKHCDKDGDKEKNKAHRNGGPENYG